MPKFLEAKLKQEYGSNSDIPYKVMNSMGAMRGAKITSKGRAMEAKHKRDMGGFISKPKSGKVGFDQRKFGGKKSARIA